MSRAIDSVPLIWAIFESAPHTLIHNDCNPRNICLRQPNSSLTSPISLPAPQLTHHHRGASHTTQASHTDSIPFQDPRTLCMYDWELATVGVPQYDLAEFLCFTLQPSTPPSVWLSLLEFYRQHLEHYSGVEFAPKEYAPPLFYSLFIAFSTLFSIPISLQRSFPSISLRLSLSGFWLCFMDVCSTLP